MKIYTKTGDGGKTGLFGGKRVSKADPRVAAYGDVDETNAAVGAAIAFASDNVKPILIDIQRDLFTLGAQLSRLRSARPGKRTPVIAADRVESLERWIDQAEERLTPLRVFILPGGAPSAALLHLARAVARRAERNVVALSRRNRIDPLIVVYLNRLSDLLFVAARLENKTAAPPVAEQPWHGG